MNVNTMTNTASNTMKMDLGVNRSLLNPRFDCYKLSTPHPNFSLRSIPLSSSKQPLQPLLESKSYALTAAKFAFNNLLSIGPSLVAFIDSQWHLVLVSIDTCKIVVSLELPRPVVSAELPPSLLLVRARTENRQHQLVIVADGAGSVHVIGVPLAAPAEAKVVTGYGHKQPVVVSDALSVTTDQALDVAALHMSIYTLAESANTSTAAVKFQGAQLVFDPFITSAPFSVTPKQVKPTWSSSAHPVLTQLSPDASTLTLAASAPIHSLCTPPPAPATSTTLAVSTIYKSKKYTWRWHQSSTDVTIHISLTSPAAKRSIQSTISATHISLMLPDLSIFSHAPFWAPVSPDDSLWTLEDNGSTLTFHLEKRDPGTRWPQLFTHGAPGAEVLETVNASEQAAHKEQIGKYTSSEALDDDDGPPPTAPVTMNDPVEDIDLLADQSRTYVARVATASASGEVVAAHTLGAYLCPATCAGGGGGGPGMCVKSDVDGLLYTPTSGVALVHSATAHAFAYVQASKRDRRMSVATSKWAAIVDVRGGVYLYVFGREREGKAPQYVVECRLGVEEEQVVGVVAVGGEGEGLGKLVVVLGQRVVCVDVDVLVSGV